MSKREEYDIVGDPKLVCFIMKGDACSLLTLSLSRSNPTSPRGEVGIGRRVIKSNGTIGALKQVEEI